MSENKVMIFLDITEYQCIILTRFTRFALHIEEGDRRIHFVHRLKWDYCHGWSFNVADNWINLLLQWKKTDLKYCIWMKLKLSSVMGFSFVHPENNSWEQGNIHEALVTTKKCFFRSSFAPPVESYKKLLNIWQNLFVKHIHENKLCSFLSRRHAIDDCAQFILLLLPRDKPWGHQVC